MGIFALIEFNENMKSIGDGMIKRVGLCVVSIFGLLLADSLASASGLTPPTNTIGFPSASVCPSIATPIYSGTNPGVAGNWSNPQRSSTGWDLHYATGIFFAAWNTFDGHGRPTWLLTDPGAGTNIAGNQFWQPFYRTQLDPVTGVKSAAYVGQFAITFVPNVPTLAAIRWQWDDAGPSAQADECIENFFLESSISRSIASPSSLIDESWNSAWSAGPSQSGWGVSMGVGNAAGQLAEFDIAHIFDDAGNPV